MRQKPEEAAVATRSSAHPDGDYARLQGPQLTTDELRQPFDRRLTESFDLIQQAMIEQHPDRLDVRT
jgi:hypothetical protein